ncbi:MAG TPA: YdcF family protein [Candidatus Acidoferrum sp.]|nr:YdcF family protein [Candidatus Acidoferrum sp.]
MRFRAQRNSERGVALVGLIVLVVLLLLLAVLFWARHPILKFAGDSWVIDAPAAHADALLLLGDDNFYADRATHAAELIRHGVAPVVVASGRRLRPSAGVVELQEHDLIERGVPKDKIIRFPHDADSTLEEAVALAKLCSEKHFRSVIVVTSNYHARRARYIFEKVFPHTISVSVAGAHDGEFDPDNWWEKRKSQELFLHEVVGMLVAFREGGGAHPGEK